MQKKNKITAKIGKRVTKFRKEMKLTQYKLADRTCRTFNTISNLERGYGDPRLSTLNDCAEALGIDLGQLISDAIYTPINNSPYFDKIIDLLKDKDDKTLAMVHDIIKTVLAANAKNKTK